MSTGVLLAALAAFFQQPVTGAASPPIEPVTERQVTETNIHLAVRQVYEVISGPAGQKRDFARMKTLFTPDARLYAVGPRGLQGGSLDNYIEKSGPFLEKVGFTETELTRRTEIYGNLAQVWSSYQGTSTDGSVNLRGINSIQLARQPDGRWLVHSILWQAESPALPLPTDMKVR